MGKETGDDVPAREMGKDASAANTAVHADAVLIQTPKILVHATADTKNTSATDKENMSATNDVKESSSESGYTASASTAAPASGNNEAAPASGNNEAAPTPSYRQCSFIVEPLIVSSIIPTPSYRQCSSIIILFLIFLVFSLGNQIIQGNPSIVFQKSGVYN